MSAIALSSLTFAGVTFADEARARESRAKALSLGSGVALTPGLGPDRAAAPLFFPPNLDEVLPDGGLPRGAVVELASPRALRRATSLCLAACAAAQAEARLRSGDPATVGAWCAFIDPWSTLHAPAVEERGVDPSRLLVVRPGLEALARTAVRVAQSRAFTLIVIDLAGVPGAVLPRGAHPAGGLAGASSVRLERWVNVVRRLALALEHTDTSVLLSTDSLARRPLPLPVALRLEVEREVGGAWGVRVAKERHGRVGPKLALAGS